MDLCIITQREEKSATSSFIRLGRKKGVKREEGQEQIIAKYAHPLPSLLLSEIASSALPFPSVFIHQSARRKRPESDAGRACADSERKTDRKIEEGRFFPSRAPPVSESQKRGGGGRNLTRNLERSLASFLSISGRRFQFVLEEEKEGMNERMKERGMRKNT